MSLRPGRAGSERKTIRMHSIWSNQQRERGRERKSECKIAHQTMINGPPFAMRDTDLVNLFDTKLGLINAVAKNRAPQSATTNYIENEFSELFEFA